MGGKVFTALREDIYRRIRADPGGPAERVVLGEVGRVGGHVSVLSLII
jgi:hypothetical protein